MFTRDEYPQRLAECNLTLGQVEKLRAVLDEMMTMARRIANTPGLDGRIEYYYNGKADGINAFDRFLRGNMQAHDEFDD
jgi:hypothetical protein